jgi:hypothetical protein
MATVAEDFWPLNVDFSPVPDQNSVAFFRLGYKEDIWRRKWFCQQNFSEGVLSSKVKHSSKV